VAGAYPAAVLWPVSAKAVVVRQGAVLLALNDRGEWELPGGRVERGEEPAAAAVREVAEETGLLVTATALLGLVPFEVVPGRFVLIAAFACSTSDDTAPRGSDEHEAVAWHSLQALDELPLPIVYRDLIARATPRRIVLIGDSHLAKLDRALLVRLGAAIDGTPTVANHAFGGATAADVLSQIDHGVLLPGDTVVVSVGTNDYASWKQVALPRFTAAMNRLLEALQHHRVIVLRPPPVDEDLQRSAGRTDVRTHDDRAPYSDAVTAIAAARGADVVELPQAAVHGPDGVHLSEHGYDLLIAALADAINGKR
jgi:8-oxo-dGTP pyrophosphatase MutT (NUDIX family)/lysophospholipase L1-like esterase